MSNVTIENGEITFKVKNGNEISVVRHNKEAIHITAKSIEIVG